MELNAEQIERVFGLPKRDWRKILRRNLESGARVDGQDPSLALFGYGELQRVSFFLTADGLRLWKDSGSVLLPEACCVCERAPVTWLASEPGTGAFHDDPPRPVHLASVPHCAEHGAGGRARLLFDAGSLSDDAVWVAMTGTNAGFLRKAQELNQRGDVPPPWIAFPRQDSYSGFWKQSGEPWMASVFRPFWEALDSRAKSEYLERWSAPDDWRELLAWIDRT
jgi:hypothetical protein